MKITLIELLVDLVNLNNFLYSLVWVTTENLGDPYIWEMEGSLKLKIRRSMTSKTRTIGSMVEGEHST